MTRLGIIIFVGLFFPLVVSANTSHVEEINFLIEKIRNSECLFIRNGKEYAAADAADHLQMKFTRVKKRIKSTEQFIEKIASKSSMSGKPYLVRCGRQDTIKSNVWFYRQLGTKRLN